MIDRHFFLFFMAGTAIEANNLLWQFSSNTAPYHAKTSVDKGHPWEVSATPWYAYVPWYP